jgi:hypothetical protein
MIIRTMPLPPTISRGQSVLNGYYAGVVERNAVVETFDYEIFKGLITRLFTVEQLLLHKVDAPALRDLLVYCNPYCRAALPARNTLKRYITSAYEHALPAVESDLRSTSTKINLSFDL